MKYVAETAKGEKYLLPPPVSVWLSCEKNAPADSFEGVFPGETVGNLASLSIYDTNNQLFFDGIVDEQTVCVKDSGMTTELVARSAAALLLDNEAMPQTYYMPSLKVIFERHAAPYGFTSFMGDARVFGGELCIKKGMSEWEAINKFCTTFLGVAPRVAKGRVLDASGTLPREELVLSDTKGISCTELQEQVKNCELFSECWIKSARTGGYDAGPADVLAQERGVRRRRFLTEGTDTQKLFAAAHAKAYEITAVCPGEPPAVLYTPVCIQQKEFYRRGLYLSRLEYRLSQSGETCRLTLKQREGKR